MLRSDEEWDALRPLMNAEDDWTFKAYRDRTREGMPRRPIAAEEADARALVQDAREHRRPGTCRSVAGTRSRPLLSTHRRAETERCREFYSLAALIAVLGRCSGAGPIAAAAGPAGGRRDHPRRHPLRRIAVSDGLHAGARDRLFRDRDGPRHHRGLCDGALEDRRSIRRSMARRADQHAGAGDDHFRLHLDRPQRNRGDPGRGRQQAAECDRRHARGRPRARSRTRRNGEGLSSSPGSRGSVTS